MSDPARQCAMMQNTQLVSPPLFNIPTKCLKKKKRNLSPWPLVCMSVAECGAHMAWTAGRRTGRGGGGCSSGGKRGIPVVPRLSLKAFRSVRRWATGNLLAGWKTARQAGGRVKIGGQGFSSLGNKHSLWTFSFEWLFVYSLTSSLLRWLQIQCLKAAGIFS